MKTITEAAAQILNEERNQFQKMTNSQLDTWLKNNKDSEKDAAFAKQFKLAQKEKASR